MTPLKRNLFCLAAMLLCAATAYGLTPRHKISEHNPMPKLDEAVPAQFGQWHAVPGSIQLIDPGQKNTLERIYDQTLARTYENNSGYRVMLSLAYGGNQRDALELHKPEICYVAQGFILNEKTRGQLATGTANIPITRVKFTHGGRIEPVTYWVTVGDSVVSDGYSKKLVEMRYGLTGQIPDGILVRISSIDANQDAAYTLHEQFAQELMASLPDKVKAKLLGSN
jgi:EpsI family protein